MKIFISYRFTGEDPGELEKFMKQVCSALQKSGHQLLTTFWKSEEFKKNNATMKTIMQTAFDYIDESDCYLQIIKSNEKSEGMLIETGYALAKNKKMASFIKKGVKTTWIKHLIEETIEYENTNDLVSKLKSIK